MTQWHKRANLPANKSNYGCNLDKAAHTLFCLNASKSVGVVFERQDIWLSSLYIHAAILSLEEIHIQVVSKVHLYVN